jgi:DNA adenine methylase
LKETQPFLKWAGGKTQLLPQMEEFFPKNYRTYFEPFLGGGAVFFHLHPKLAVLADSNPDLIGAFLAVRDEPNRLMAALDRFIPDRLREDFFYKVRGLEPELLSPVERAARTIFLNKTCFNGLYRVNARGAFNAPWGGYKNPTLYNRSNLLAASQLLLGKRIVLADYRRVIARAKFGDFVYLDPPYHPLNATSSFTSYTKEDFGDAQQRELAETFQLLDRKGVLLMLSNSATPLVRSLYADFRLEILKAKRAINSKGTGRGAVDELLVMNY